MVAQRYPGLERVDAVETSTRERILLEASYLFSRWGYHGTTTRAIATAVGVRQPSLYSHFSSKQAIMETLLALNLDRAVSFAMAMSERSGSPAARLYQVLKADLDYVTSVPYDLSGTQGEDIMSDPNFARGASQQRKLHDAWRGIVEQGIRQGQFVPYDTGLIQQVIEGVFKEMIRTTARRPAERDGGSADAVARFMVRAILVNPSDIERIVAEADQLDRDEKLAY
jgi:AcrR family transcriptional regulator